MLDVYGTYPATQGATPEAFTGPVRDVLGWSEAAGLRGLLIFTDNFSMDPWAAAQFMFERTTDLVPMIAVQPNYMHPYAAARMVSTLGSLYGRRVDLNLVTGGYRPHMRAVGCSLEHDERYTRLVEYGKIMARLLRGAGPVDHRGTHYDMAAADLQPRNPPGLAPRLFLGGSSPAAVAAAQALDATRLTYPRAITDYRATPDALAGVGIRVGVIARDRSAEAWQIAHRRFPKSRLNEAFRRAASKRVEAEWHDSLWRDAHRPPDAEDAYWLHPFRASNEFCPYLVGSHEEVAEALATYLRMGVTTLILNESRTEDDLCQALEAVRRADRQFLVQ